MYHTEQQIEAEAEIIRHHLTQLGLLSHINGKRTVDSQTYQPGWIISRSRYSAYILLTFKQIKPTQAGKKSNATSGLATIPAPTDLAVLTTGPVSYHLPSYSAPEHRSWRSWTQFWVCDDLGRWMTNNYRKGWSANVKWPVYDIATREECALALNKIMPRFDVKIGSEAAITPAAVQTPAKGTRLLHVSLPPVIIRRDIIAANWKDPEKGVTKGLGHLVMMGEGATLPEGHSYSYFKAAQAMEYEFPPESVEEFKLRLVAKYKVAYEALYSENRIEHFSADEFLVNVYNSLFMARFERFGEGEVVHPLADPFAADLRMHNQLYQNILASNTAAAASKHNA